MPVPNRAEHPNRKVGYDAQRGVGTYNPLAGTERKAPGGFSQLNNARETYEKRANTQIPGFTSENPWKSMRNTPGSGLK